jgi:hypothetical protein
MEYACACSIFGLVHAGVAQLVEQLICNQQVVGSSPSAGSDLWNKLGRYSSGQRGQTVNLLTNVYEGSNPSLPTGFGKNEEDVVREHSIANCFFTFSPLT